MPDGQEGGVEHRFHLVDALNRDGELLWPIPENLSTIHGVSTMQAERMPNLVSPRWCGRTGSLTVQRS